MAIASPIIRADSSRYRSLPANGPNVLTYATNRELKNKLDRPLLLAARGGTDADTRGVLHIPKLLHSGGGDDAPNALPNLLAYLRDQGMMRVRVENRLVSADDPACTITPCCSCTAAAVFASRPRSGSRLPLTCSAVE